MKKDTLKKANSILEIINRLEEINMSISDSCADISICGNNSAKIKAIKSSSNYSELERIEDEITSVIKNAGKEYLAKILQQKQKELDEL